MKTQIAHKHDHTRKTASITVAFEVDEFQNVFAYAISRCNPKDNFSRMVGRTKAIGRLNSPKYRKEIQPVPRTEFLEAFFNLGF